MNEFIRTELIYSNTSIYRIFYNQKNESLVHYVVPKNANTSVKLFLATHCNLENNYELTSEVPGFLRENYTFLKAPLYTFIPSKQVFSKIDATYKICIIRDPIERFISTYCNRILFHRNGSYKDNTIDEVILKIKHKIEDHHLLPQSYYLGRDINYFTHIFNMKNLNDYEKLVNNFFNNYLNFPMTQQTKRDKVSLTKNQIEALQEIYSEDLELLNKINLN